jgi:hypothetical protein
MPAQDPLRGGHKTKEEEMKRTHRVYAVAAVALLGCSHLYLAKPQLAASTVETVKIDWTKVLRVSKTTATLQVVGNPLLRPPSPIHDQVFLALKNLQPDYVRYCPYFPFPKLAVAELDPPHDGKTSWDFSLIDPITVDTFEATAGHPLVFNFSTIPEWMYKTPKPVPYPADPDQVDDNYLGGTELRDPSMKELGDYWARLAGWYTQGGFTDEYGKWHASNHHFKIACWEVLNEIQGEHHLTPEGYARIYDATVEAVRRVSPQTQFVGLGLPNPTGLPDYVDYFLDHKHHKPGIPLDLIAYHFYAHGVEGEPFEAHQYTFFAEADHWLAVVGYIEVIRQRLSSETKSDINEIGTYMVGDSELVEAGHGFPDAWWNLSAAVYAYVYGNLARRGIDIAGESQMVGSPTQAPSVTMIDWKTGQLNAKYWVLKLLVDNFVPGDKLVDTQVDMRDVYAQGFLTRQGVKKILLVNKRQTPRDLSIAGMRGGRLQVVDKAFEPAASRELSGDRLTLQGFAVAVVTLPR